MPDQSAIVADHMSIDGELFVVLVNLEEQYSIWPAGKPAPSGWQGVCSPQAKADCLAWVEAHWTDMRPKSLRDEMGS